MYTTFYFYYYVTTWFSFDWKLYMQTLFGLLIKHNSSIILTSVRPELTVYFSIFLMVLISITKLVHQNKLFWILSIFLTNNNGLRSHHNHNDWSMFSPWSYSSIYCAVVTQMWCASTLLPNSSNIFIIKVKEWTPMW